ncbi:MAG: hypothetical protein ACK5MF_06100 [Vibrio sp.]
MSFYKLNPDLKNTKAFERFKDGRKVRFKCELNDLQNGIEPRLHQAPLYSHNATWQSQFRRGFESVTANDLAQYRYRYAQKHQPKAIKPSVNIGAVSSTKHPHIERVLKQHSTRNDHVCN